MSIINISNQNIAGDCNLKCSYIFDYHNSSVSATNSGFSIDLTYDKSYISPVIYNNNKYQVQSISIYSPSIHLFNDAQANAEIVITHNALVSGPQLNVAIPIIVSGDLTKASTLLMKLINDVSSNAPSQGESTNLNMSTFNLNTFIPVKIPLYSYTQQSSNINWIVFGKENAIL
jgi:carbonic anhydrase